MTKIVVSGQLEFMYALELLCNFGYSYYKYSQSLCFRIILFLKWWRVCMIDADEIADRLILSCA